MSNRHIERALTTIEVALSKANQLVDIACDWNLDEVEIDEEMVPTRTLAGDFNEALEALALLRSTIVERGGMYRTTTGGRLALGWKPTTFSRSMTGTMGPRPRSGWRSLTSGASVHTLSRTPISPYFWDYSSPPAEEQYRQRKWTAEEATHYQIYETVTEGTPVSPIFASLDDMIEWLVEGQVNSRPAAEAFARMGWAPTMLLDMKNGVLLEGIESTPMGRKGRS
jgi:hypothetical protein